ncbi:hypothetical protein [Thermovibrio sp.]
MGIYDRDYYREKKEKGGSSLSRTVFKLTWYLIVFFFVVAFIVYVLAIFSEK